MNSDMRGQVKGETRGTAAQGKRNGPATVIHRCVAAFIAGAVGVIGLCGLVSLARALPDAAAAPAPLDAGAPASPVPPATVRIVFKVVPPTPATITWGRKRLGFVKPKAPLVVERPRDSGPLDVVVRADGCLPVHTRAYTFTSNTVAVRVTPIDKKNTIYGYREELPPEVDGGSWLMPGVPDGGVPAPQAPSP